MIYMREISVNVAKSSKEPIDEMILLVISVIRVPAAPPEAPPAKRVKSEDVEIVRMMTVIINTTGFWFIVLAKTFFIPNIRRIAGII